MNYSQDRNLPQGYFQKTQFKNTFTFASVPATKAGEKGEEQQNNFDFSVSYKKIPKPNELQPQYPASICEGQEGIATYDSEVAANCTDQMNNAEYATEYCFQCCP